MCNDLLKKNLFEKFPKIFSGIGVVLKNKEINAGLV